MPMAEPSRSPKGRGREEPGKQTEYISRRGIRSDKIRKRKKSRDCRASKGTGKADIKRRQCERLPRIM